MQVSDTFGSSAFCTFFLVVTEKKEKTSKYEGVCWHAKRGKWYAQLRIIDQIQTYGGYFNDELDAAKRINQLCEVFGIPLRNPIITGIPDQQYQVLELRLYFSFKTL